MDVEDDIKTNPWEVNNLDQFLYFCCPECDEREKSKELFLQHALDQHPRAKEHHQNYLIKKEPIDFDIQDYDANTINGEVKCEVEINLRLADDDDQPEEYVENDFIESIEDVKEEEDLYIDNDTYENDIGTWNFDFQKISIQFLFMNSQKVKIMTSHRTSNFFV